MNWKSLLIFASILGLAAAMAACSGVTVADFIKVDVNEGVQESTEAPAKIKLSEAPFVREKYVNNFKTDLAQLDKEISDAQFFADLIGSAVNTGLELSEGPLKGVPLGGLAFSLLGALGGLFLNKPGTQKKIDEAWDEATEEAKKALLEGINAGKGSA